MGGTPAICRRSNKTNDYSIGTCQNNHIAKDGVAQRQSDIHFMQETNNPNVDGGPIPPAVPNQATLSKMEMTATIKDAMAMALET